MAPSLKKLITLGRTKRVASSVPPSLGVTNQPQQNETGADPGPQSNDAIPPTDHAIDSFSKKDSLGLKVLHNPDSATLDIVFLHGLTGNAYSTWLCEDSNTHWPRDLIKKDTSNARIMTFGYDADVVNFWGQAAQDGISGYAKDLLGKLSRKRQHDLDRKIVFVVHSLGGLVTQRALTMSRESRHPHLQNIEACTVGICFLGTPHHGSDLARWGSVLKRIASIAKPANSAPVDLLKRGSEMLRDVQDGFHNLLEKRKDEGAKIGIVCFYETLPLVRSLVVPKESAIISGELDYPLRANHTNMTKFSSRDAPGYEDVVGEVQRLARNVPQQKAPITTTTNRNRGSGTQNLDTEEKAFLLIPFRRDKDFVERGTLLGDIQEKLSAPASRVALIGLGGVGKSQLAIEHCYRVEDASPETWVFWVHAATQVRFEEGYRRIAKATKMNGWDDPKADIVRLVYNWLSDKRNGRWLMIVDNADDGSVFFKSRAADISDQPGALPVLSNFLPQTPTGSILFTSRSREVAQKLTGDFDSIIEVNPMSKDDALALLRHKLGFIAREDEAVELAHALDFMPLALTQATAFIKQRAPRMCLSGYIEKIHRSDSDQAWLLEKDVGDLRRDGHASNSIIATWHISFEYIRQQRPTAARLLSLMSLFDRQGIPESLLHGRYARSEGDDADLAESDDNADFEDDIQTLTSFSLVEISADGREFEMHRLVQFSTKKWLELSNELELWKKTYVTLMDEICPDDGEYENWPTWQALFPHAEAVFNNTPKEAEALEAWASVLHKAAWYASEMGQYSKAYEMGSLSLQVTETVLGTEHENTLQSLNILAIILEKQGQYDEAEAMYKQALEGTKRILGEEHPDTLISYNNLGVVLNRQGQYDEAEAMHRQALEGRKRILGEEHPDTLMSYNNLGAVLDRQGQYDEAEAMHEQALEGRKRISGEDHPATLTSMSNLALVYQEQGRYKDAEALQVQVLEISRMQLGGEHPDTLASLNNLALTYRKQGRYKEAEALQVQELEICRMQLGGEHPDTLISMSNLALTYQEQGRYKDAEALQVQVLEICRMQLGGEHPDTLTIMNNLAFTLKDMGFTSRAISMMEDCYESRSRVLGSQHPQTIESREELGAWRLEALQIDAQDDS